MAKKPETVSVIKTEATRAARMLGDLLREAGNELTRGGYPNGVSRGEAQAVAVALIPILKQSKNVHKKLIHVLGSL